MAKMTLKVEVKDLDFQYQPRLSHNACFVQIWLFEPKSFKRFSMGKLNFIEFWVKKTEMTLRIKVNDPIFNTNRVCHGAC